MQNDGNFVDVILLFRINSKNIFMPRCIPYKTDWVLEPENLYLKFDVFLDAAFLSTGKYLVMFRSHVLPPSGSSRHRI